MIRIVLVFSLQNVSYISFPLNEDSFRKRKKKKLTTNAVFKLLFSSGRI